MNQIQEQEKFIFKENEGDVKNTLNSLFKINSQSYLNENDQNPGGAQKYLESKHLLEDDKCSLFDAEQETQDTINNHKVSETDNLIEKLTPITTFEFTKRRKINSLISNYAKNTTTKSQTEKITGNLLGKRNEVFLEKEELFCYDKKIKVDLGENDKIFQIREINLNKKSVNTDISQIDFPDLKLIKTKNDESIQKCEDIKNEISRCSDFLNQLGKFGPLKSSSETKNIKNQKLDDDFFNISVRKKQKEKKTQNFDFSSPISLKSENNICLKKIPAEIKSIPKNINNNNLEFNFVDILDIFLEDSRVTQTKRQRVLEKINNLTNSQMEEENESILATETYKIFSLTLEKKIVYDKLSKTNKVILLMFLFARFVDKKLVLKRFSDYIPSINFTDYKSITKFFHEK